jgi:hypothetical protein
MIERTRLLAAGVGDKLFPSRVVGIIVNPGLKKVTVRASQLVIL